LLFLVSSLFRELDQFELLKLPQTIGLDFKGFQACSALATAPGFQSSPEGEVPQSHPLGE
jgi:hypothetical protein